MADEYLSGNVREKLRAARKIRRAVSGVAVNVQALEKVQPKDLAGNKISVRLWRDLICLLMFPGSLCMSFRCSMPYSIQK